VARDDDQAFGMVKELAAKEGVLADRAAGRPCMRLWRWLEGWVREPRRYDCAGFGGAVLSKKIFEGGI
jgi:hypothetical protein